MGVNKSRKMKTEFESAVLNTGKLLLIVWTFIATDALSTVLYLTLLMNPGEDVNLVGWLCATFYSLLMN